MGVWEVGIWGAEADNGGGDWWVGGKERECRSVGEGASAGGRCEGNGRGGELVPIFPSMFQGGGGGGGRGETEQTSLAVIKWPEITRRKTVFITRKGEGE